MRYKNSISYSGEGFSLLMDLASHGSFQYDRSSERKKEIEYLKRLEEIRMECKKEIGHSEDIKRYFFDYGDTTHCLAGILCGISTMTTLSISEMEKRYSQLTWKERLSFLKDGEDQMMLHAFMELLDASDLMDEEKLFQWNALLDPEKHKEKIFSLLKKTEHILKRYSSELKDIYVTQKKALKTLDVRQFIQEKSSFQFENEFPDQAQILLFDPFTLKLSDNKKDVNPCVIGAFIHLGLQENPVTCKETVLTYAKIFSDESKLNILNLLSKQKMMNHELAEKTGLTSATISHHMSVLTDCKLVKATVLKNKVIYEVNREKISEIMKIFDRYFQDMK